MTLTTRVVTNPYSMRVICLLRTGPRRFNEIGRLIEILKRSRYEQAPEANSKETGSSIASCILSDLLPSFATH